MNAKNNTTKVNVQAAPSRIERMKHGAKLVGTGAAVTGAVAVGIGLSALGHYAMTTLGQKIWSAI